MRSYYPRTSKNQFPLRIATLLLIVSVAQLTVRSQVATVYTVLPSAGSYSAISGGSILFGGALEFGTIGDDISGAQTIAPFNFGGTTYTQIFVSANGFITFGSAPAAANYTPISSAAGYAGAISAFGTNLQNTNADFTLSTQQRSVRIQTVGSEVVVQWRGMRRQGVNNENFNFQIRLNTANNVIKIVYGPIAGQGSAVTFQPEVGLRGPTNTFATDVKNIQIVSAETWALPANGTAAANTMAFTSAPNPDKVWTSGLTYTFTPCAAPTVGVTPPASTVCQGNGVALSAAGATSYSWAPATDLSATTGPAVTATPANTITYTVTGTNPACPFAGSATATITVNPAPTVTATSGAAGICASSSTTVSAIASAPVSATSSAASGALNVNLPGTSAALTAHSLAIAGGNGNIGSDITISVTLNATTANAQNSDLDFYLIGPGNCGAMEISTDNGGSGDNYAGALLRTPSAFTNINTLGNVGNISGSFSPEGNINTPANAASAIIGSYALPATALAGCPVNGNWTIAIGNDNALFPATFTGWNLTIEKTVVGNFTHAFSGPGTISGVTNSGNNNSTGTVTVSNAPVGLQTYTVQTTSPVNGCITTRTVDIQVGAPPNAGSGNGSAVVCYNASSISLFTSIPGTPEQTGTWSPALSNAGGYLGNFMPGTDAPTTYTYSVPAVAPCTASASRTVAVSLSTVDADSDGILYCDDTCIGVQGSFGSTCNFTPGNGYALGQINASCNCVQVENCAPLYVTISTDNSASDETTFQILDNSETVVCSANIPAFANPITAPYPDCCLPPTGCYRLRVTESGGDGMMVGTLGGYQLREGGASGKRIIDNTANFSDQASSAPDVSTLMTNADNGRFCLPVGSNKPVFQHCDKLDWANDNLVALVATEDPLVSAWWSSSAPPSDKGYEFWWFDPNGTYSFRRFRSHATSDGYSPASATRACKVKINGWANTPTSPWLTVGKLYNVRIRARYGAGNYSPFGPACLFKIDPAAATCPLVKLQDNPANLTDYSCGVTRYFGGGASAGINMNSMQPGSAVNWGNKIVATPPQPIPAVASANVRYQFRFVNHGEYPAPGSCIIRPPQTNPTIYLNWTTGDKLKCGIDYSVDVRVSLDNGVTWCVGGNTITPSITQYPKTYWGPVCAVSIRMNNNASCPVNGFISDGSNLALTTNGGSLTIYPNPNRGDQLYISLSEVAADVRTVNVDIYDMTGKKVSARTIAVQDGYVKTALELNGDLSGGLYLVNITAADKTYTQRLVIQP